MTISLQGRVDMYASYLEEEGYRPTTEGSFVWFKSEGRTYGIFVDEKDPEFFQLLFVNFWSIDAEEERRQALECSGKVTANCKVAKVFLSSDQSNTWASVESFLEHPADFAPVFPRAFNALCHAADSFGEEMREARSRR